nr:Hpt domain-containing protein [Pseudomonas fuscovaginae]
MLSGEQWNQLLLGFLSEGRDLLKEAEDSLLRLETCPDDQEAINGLFRAVHTLKGSAGIFSLTPLVNLTHHLETPADVGARRPACADPGTHLADAQLHG